MSFAEPMKAIAATILGITPEQLDEYKNDFVQFGLIIQNNYDSATEHRTNCREFLQRLGSDAIKPWFGNDVWSKLLLGRIENSTADVIIIPDWRFEIEEITSSLKIRITSNMCDLTDTHVSETELDNYPAFDLILNNDNYNLTQPQIEWLVSTDRRFNKC